MNKAILICAIMLLGTVMSNTLYAQCPGAPSSGSSESACGGGTFNMSAVNHNVPEGGSITHYWYTTSSGGSPFATLTASPPYSGSGSRVSGYQAQLTVTTTYWVSSSCNGGAQSSGRTAVTVTINAPTVSIQVNKISFCSGETLLLSSNYSAASYAWLLSGNQFSTSASTSLPVSTDANAPNAFSPGDVITLQLTNITGCAMGFNGSANSSSIPIVINPLLTPSVTLTNPGNVCSPAAVSFTATPTNGGSPYYQFYLDNSSTPVQSGSSNTYNAGSLSAGSHYAFVVMTSNAACLTQPTGTSTTQNFTVTAKGTYTVSLSNPTICSHDPNVTLYANPNTSFGTYTYRWKKNGSYIGSPSTTNYYSFTGVVNGDNLQCEVSSDYWCVNTPVNSNTYTVAMTSSVTPWVSVQVSPLTYCAGTSISLGVNSNMNLSGATFAWTVNGNSVGGNNQNISVPTQMTSQVGYYSPGSNIQLTVTGLGGLCVTATSASDTDNNPALTINPMITPSVTLTNPGSVCNPASVSFTATPTNGGGSPTYQFWLDNAPVQTGPSNTYNAGQLSAANHTAYVVMTSNASCLTQSTGTSAVQGFTVANKATYTVGITGPLTICSGTPSGAFMSNVTNGIGTLSYQWMKGGSPISGQTAATMTNPTVSTGDVITLQVSSSYWCVNTPATSNPYNVTVTNSINPTVAVTVSPLTYCAGEPVTFGVSSNVSLSSAHYAWLLNSGAFGGDNPSIQVPTTSNYLPNYYAPGGTISVTVTGLTGTCLTGTSAGNSGPPLTINPLPTIPAVPTITNNCNSTTLQRGTPGDGSAWYWQGTNAAGTDIGTGAAAATYNVTTANTYYLRPRFATGCWGPSRSVVATVYNTPAAPPDPVTADNTTCGANYVFKPTPPSGVSYYWQGANSSGTDQTSALATGSDFEIPAQNTTYYLRARLDAFTCWSVTTPFKVGIDPVEISLNSYNAAEPLAQATLSVKLTPGFTVTPGNVFIARISPIPCNDQMNWQEEIAYDMNGAIISDGRVYLDGNGAALQSQSKDFINQKVWAIQPLINSYGEAVGTTLPAPIVGTEFNYRQTFLANQSSSRYASSDFDKRTETGAAGEINNPVPVGTSPGTVGWYYSSANNLEPATPVTQYPYSRGYSKEGPDPVVSTSASVGDQFRMGAGHNPKSERFFISPNELDHYYTLRSNHFPYSSTPTNQGFKYISTDQEGKMSASFMDADGRSVATATVLTRSSSTPPVFTYENWSYTYYNEVGRVVATVAPNGVIIGQSTYPQFVTTFKYDYLGRVIETTSPDEGTSRFVFSTNGKIRFSQNSKQSAQNQFSYTNYDYLGRLIEAGEYTSNGTNPFVFEPHTTASPSQYSVLSIIDNVGFTGITNTSDPSNRCNEHSYIYYDTPGTGSPATQTYLNGQVSKTENENASTWYSYNEFGHLSWSIQSINGLSGNKRIDYSYDYYGNVTQVAYQAGQIDKFYHHYEYDAQHRLVNALTSLDGITKTLRAKYKYYLHGPLKRVEIGGNLQGLDYVYTINGSLKTINHSDSTRDPGTDAPGVNGFSKDVFGEMLNYHANDYSGAGYSAGTLSAPPEIEDHYNGLVKAISWSTPVDFPRTKKVYGYEYDSRRRFKNAKFGLLSGTLAYTATFPNEAYREGNLTYDKNGNIQALLRKGKTANTVANYSYNYTSGKNQLDNVTGSPSTIDYDYNVIGQMTQQTEGSAALRVTYNAHGLVKDVKNASDQLMLAYYYDDRGNLVKRETYNAGSLAMTTFIVSDVPGNTVAMYEMIPTGPTLLVEVPVYGTGRVGVYKPVANKWFYEINDHLGNVRAVIGPPETKEYLATMETENAGAPNDEDLKFKNTIAPRATFVAANNTPGGNEVIRLNNTRVVGPAIRLTVAPGDVISAEVWAYYEGGSGYSNTIALSTLVNSVAAAFGGVSGAPGEAGQLYNTLNGSLGGFGGASGSGNDLVPAAYLNMIMFDNNITADPTTLPMSAVPVPATASFAKQKITIGPITIPTAGYVYIYVNDNSNTANYVYFDDLKVTHLQSAYVAGADYYPFGLTMSDREIKTEPYRFGYQGQYSEENTTTGWNEFELRMYDPRIGRWISPDPWGQFASPYLGMGNNPITNVDPNGGTAVDPTPLTKAFFNARVLDEVVISAVAGGEHFFKIAASPGLFTAGELDAMAGEREFNAPEIPGNKSQYTPGRYMTEPKTIKDVWSSPGAIFDAEFTMAPPTIAKGGGTLGEAVRVGRAPFGEFATQAILMAIPVSKLALVGKGVQRFLFASKYGKAMFYTGVHGDEAMASAVAVENGLMTINQTLGGRALNYFNVTNTKVWHWASAGYARNVQGQVYLYVGPYGKSVHSTWIQVEKVILDSRGMTPIPVY